MPRCYYLAARVSKMKTYYKWNPRLATSFALSLGAMLLFASPVVAQQSKAGATTSATPPLTRKTTRSEKRRLGYGGTVTIVGAPQGSIRIEGWSRNEVEVIGDIELSGSSEENLSQLATVNGFVVDDDANHVRILTTGTHDKMFMRRVAKNFPKKLLGLPWKIDYRIRVPQTTDLEINAGRGPVSLDGVEGAINLTVTEGETKMTLTGGTVIAQVGQGRLDLNIPVRSWRRGGVEIRVASGDLNVELPSGFNGDIDADILRNGRIEDAYGGLESREKPGITERIVRARAGSGGAFFRFTVGDGTIRIKKAEMSEGQ